MWISMWRTVTANGKKIGKVFPVPRYKGVQGKKRLIFTNSLPKQQTQVSSSRDRLLYPLERTEKEAGWVWGPVCAFWRREKSLAPTRIRIAYPRGYSHCLCNSKHNCDTVSVRTAARVALPVATRRQHAYSLMVVYYIIYYIMGERIRGSVSEYSTHA